MPISKKENMRKSIVRNPECKPQSNRLYAHNSCENCQPEQEKDVKSETSNNVWTIPRINSSAKMLCVIQDLENMPSTSKNSKADLTPKTCKILAPKLTKRMNFKTDEVVFKNLIPLNINDSILPEKKTDLRKKYFKTQKNEIPEPELADFLDPLPPLTIPLPEINRCQQTLPSNDSFERYTNYFEKN